MANKNGCPLSPDICTAAAKSGELGVLKWLRENKCPWDSSTTAGAAEYENLKVLKWVSL